MSAAVKEAAATAADPSHQLYEAAAAGNAEEVNSLLDDGADVMWQDAEGTTALMKAAENGHQAVVALLLEGGAPWNQQDNDGYCAGEYATASKNQDIVELIMQWGVQAELTLMAAERDGVKDSSTSGSGDPSSNAAYLKQKLVYTPEGDKLLDADGEAVMMGWEDPLKEQHARVMCGQGGGHYLNVGFGLGIIDTYIQGYNPASHTIIEAHPDVYAHMLSKGWDKKPGVRILFGRWQDVLPQLETYDGIFFDTYGEYYSEGGEGIRTFHESVPKLLRPGGVYSYFNGFASDNFFFHMVYGRVVQVELEALGLQTSFQQLRVAELGDEVWQGVHNKYWKFPLYFLPVVKHAAVAEAQNSNTEDVSGTS